MVKIESLAFPTTVQRQLLEMLEQARPWRIPPRSLPEMSRGELIRAIRWRLGTIPLGGAITAAEFVAQYRRRRSATKRSQALRAGRTVS